jgi:two-component system sensor histidine kinase LytS
MSIEQLSLILIERASLLTAVSALVLVWLPFTAKGSLNFNKNEKIFLAIFFGLIGIAGTLSGGRVSQSIANLRGMGVVTAGLVGGPFVGTGAGIIAGLHRFLADPSGFSSIPCALATILEGFVAGRLFYYQKNYPDYRFAGGLAFAGESVHMLMVLFLSKPFESAKELVEIIAVPMILSNTFGAMFFCFVVLKIFQSREKESSTEAEVLLRIVKNTVAHLRHGLNLESAGKTCEIIYKNLFVAAVSITDKSSILAHFGEGDDHHRAGLPIQTEFTKRVLQGKKYGVVRSNKMISCRVEACPLNSAVVVPLRKKGEIIGTLKLYGSKKHPLSPKIYEITKGLAELFSIQLELEDIAISEKMLAHAEIRRLNAQIQPHFLFNALNTIASFIRTQPEKARELIGSLSLYMRKNLYTEKGIISLAEEMEQVRAYIAIEKARFGGRIEYLETIDKDLEDFKIPRLIIQPFVENCVRHGLKNIESGGIVEVMAVKKEKGVFFTIRDNGSGMPAKSEENDFLNIEPETGGIGIKNCHERLVNIYGEDSGLCFETKKGKGTSVKFFIPEKREYQIGEEWGKSFQANALKPY